MFNLGSLTPSFIYLFIYLFFLIFFQVLNEATEDNLIDLGPGSPAVVTPRITSSPQHNATPTRTSTAPNPNQSPASLSSALACLGIKKQPLLGLANMSQVVLDRHQTVSKPHNPSIYSKSTTASLLETVCN